MEKRDVEVKQSQLWTKKELFVDIEIITAMGRGLNEVSKEVSKDATKILASN